MPTDIATARPVEDLRIGRLRWSMVVWAAAAGILNYLDRSAVSIAAPEMMREFHLTRTDIGLMGSVFSWCYAVAQLPAGWLVDRLGVRRVYALAIGIWSLATALMAGGGRLWQFLGLRALLGFAESPNAPASCKITVEWFPRAERGQATSVWDSGSKWGPAIAPPILTAILLAFGWRAIFVVLGVGGVLLALAFFAIYRSPEEHPRLGDAERVHILADRVNDTRSLAGVPWAELFKHRQTWGMMAGFFCIIWVWNIFIVFLPLYLQEARGVSIGKTGLLASIPYLGAAVLGLGGGLVITWYARHSARGPLNAKRHIVAVASVVAGVMICLIPLVASLTLALLAMTLALGFIATMTAAAWSLPGDIVDRSRAASLGAIQNFGGYFGGAFAPLLTGMIADRTGSYQVSFITAGIIASLAAVAYLTLVRRPLGTSS